MTYEMIYVFCVSFCDLLLWPLVSVFVDRRLSPWRKICRTAVHRKIQRKCQLFLKVSGDSNLKSGD